MDVGSGGPPSRLLSPSAMNWMVVRALIWGGRKPLQGRQESRHRAAAGQPMSMRSCAASGARQPQGDPAYQKHVKGVAST